MGRTTNKLTARSVETIKELGRHSDGGGLYLKITPAGRRWVFMYAWREKRVELGLGTAADVSLKQARETAQRYRSMLAQKQDPREERASEKEKQLTFGEFALDFVKTQEPSWRNDKHRDQWFFTLSLRKDDDGRFTDEGYCTAIRDLPIAEVDTEHVIGALKPIWQTKPETASRLRGRIEAVLNAAKVMKLRSGENPAAWRGHLSNILTKKQRLTRGHHAAMPFKDVPNFLSKLLAAPTPSNAALGFTILTAARSGEAMGATWQEIDLEAALWRVPAARMKGGREHLVPLSDGAIQILTVMQSMRPDGNNFVFPGQRGKGLSVMALTMAMRRLEKGQYTPHGFRSAFRDWAGDETTFARDDIELCLAHAIANKVEAAYRRGQALEKRRLIMNTWWKYLSGDSNNVVQLEASA
ncbi:site-specific integrase [Rhizobium deserti]|uniref:Site-specific integrase n=1 Tax=Rhizobium deserti TaxID=2547961 RepID=A0A4R5UP56_9HYPH|nr:site-specific integrase [Rhizobium deserti]TDK39722.1 site-specific integrase [Rhizobium deserti]